MRPETEQTEFPQARHAGHVRKKTQIIATLVTCALWVGVHAELPLAAERVARFTTSEGTWMSVDIAPDGSEVYFDLLGDIYAVSSEGGKARRLVGGMDYAVQPAVSPDGTQLAYVSDRSGSMNLWLLDLGSGESRQFTHESAGEQIFFSGPEWTPDGRSVAAWTTRRRNWFQGNLPREIRLYGLASEGAEYRSLTGSGAGSIEGAEYPAFGGGGRYLYFSLFNHVRSPFYGDRVLPEWQLVAVDLVSGTFAPLTAPFSHPGGGFSPAASPDGRLVVYGSRYGSDTGLRIIDRHTGEDRWLAFPIDRDQQESNFFYNLPGMAFTPDSSAVIAAFGGKINRIDVATGKVQTIEFEADVEQGLGPLVQPEFRVNDREIGVRQVRHPRMSPDRSEIVFEALDRLWVIGGDGGEKRRLVERESQQYQAAYSPDGGSIVFADWTADDGGHLYVVSGRDRSVPKRITQSAAHYYAPAFSQDGGTVFVTRLGGGHPEAMAPPVELLAVSVSNGEMRTIQTLQPASLDGDGVIALGRPYGLSGDDGRLLVGLGASLLSIALPAGDAVQSVAQVRGVSRPYTPGAAGLNVMQAESIVPSPDGSRLAVNIGSHVFLVEADEGNRETWGALSISEPAPEGLAFLRLSGVGGEFPSWSPDGRSLLYAIGSTIFRHDADGSGHFSADDARAIDVGIRAPVHNPEGRVLLENVRIITMNGDEVIEDGAVLIDGHRIAEVGTQLIRPPDAHVIDGAGMTVMPGIVDTHAHPDTQPHVAARVPQSWPMLNYLAYGVTTIHDPAQPVADLVEGDLIAAGRALGPRVFGTGPQIVWKDLAMHMQDTDGDEDGSVRQFVQRYSDHWRTNTIKQYVSGDRAMRQRIAMASRELGVLPTIEGEDHNYNVTHVIDGYGDLAHAMGVAPFYDDVLSLMQEAGTSVQYQFGTLRGEGAPSAMYYFLNLVDPLSDAKARRFMPVARMQSRLLRRLEFHHSEHAFPLMARQAAALMRRGVTVSLGDHGEWGGIGDHWEMWAAASGMSNHEALRMATLLGARAIGLERDIGSIEAGKLADFIVIEGNPLADIRDTLAIRLVVKNGEFFDADTLDRIWPDPRALHYDRWWQDKAPAVREGSRKSGGAPAFSEYFPD